MNCNNGVVFGCKHCSECLENAKIRSAERYERIKKERICKTCSNAVGEIKGIYCSECRLVKKRRLDNLKKEGLCVTCGKTQATNGQKCQDCHCRYTNYVRNNKKNRFEQGLCSFCDTPRVGAKLCLVHYLQFTCKFHLGTTKRYKELEELFFRQNGRCPYTNNILTLGIDASIDHIIPKSRGGSKEIENLQWVYYKVNFMKGDMLNEEFRDMINCISNYFGKSSINLDHS